MSHASAAPFLFPLSRHGGESAPLRTLGLWWRRSASRSDLARLDARALRDIGLSRFDAEIECSKPFWQA